MNACWTTKILQIYVSVVEANLTNLTVVPSISKNIVIRIENIQEASHIDESMVLKMEERTETQEVDWIKEHLPRPPKASRNP